MASRTIHHGQTAILDHGLVFGGTLTIQGGLINGRAGGAGVIGASGSLANDGFITVQAGAAPTETKRAGLAGTLDNRGSLANHGAILLDGGSAASPDLSGSYGGRLSNEGTLSNAGTITATGGGLGAGEYYYGGRGGSVSNTGVLLNTGQIDLQGGAGAGTYYRAGANAGYLRDVGVVINSGAIAIGGGTGGDRNSYGGSGAFLDSSGTVDNSGLITIGGSAYGDGGDLAIRGVMHNTGQITGGTAASNGEVSVFGTLYDTGTITMPLRAVTIGDLNTETARSAILLSGGAVLTGNIANFGTIAGSGTIHGTLLDTGVITAQGGVLAIDARLGDSFGHGYTVGVDTGATLKLTGFVDSTIQVQLASGATFDASSANAGLHVISPSGGTLVVLGSAPAMLNAADTNLTVDLAQPGVLTLSQMGFVTAIGSTGADVITALAISQTLTGGAGADRLTGASATGDIFHDIASGLNGDTIGNFAGTDVIDVTDLMPGSALSLTYVQTGAQGTLTLAEAGQSVAITLLGTFSQGDFVTASDQHGGLLVSLHH